VKEVCNANSIFNRAQSLYGDDAYPFCIQWSQDATITSSGGGATIYEIPCYYFIN